MSLFAQHGYGKSNKIELALADKSISGVIFSPKDDNMQKITDYTKQLHTLFPSAHLLFDPQFYVSTIPNANEGKLLSYPYYKSNLTRRDFSKTSNLATYVKETLDFQATINLTHLIAPTIMIDSFNDPWSQIAISLADEAATYQSISSLDKPIYVSLCIHEDALKNTDELNEFLDMISLLEVYGFYIVIIRNTSTSQIINPTILENLLSLCYVLATINQYDVIMGYSDLVGLPLYATGISGISTGWFKSLQSFSINRFLPSTGGRAARARYTSAPLLNSILINPEMDTIFRQGLISDILSNTNYDSTFLRNLPSSISWPPQQSILHHWMTLQDCIEDIDKIPNISGKLDYICNTLDSAAQLYNKLMGANVIFEPSSSNSFINDWKTAISSFRVNMGV